MNNDYAMTSVQKIALADLGDQPTSGKRLFGNAMEVIREMKIKIHASAGQCDLTVQELLDLRENAVLTLDKLTTDPVDIMVDGKIIARGMLVAVEDNFGVRITEIHGS
jgi:flagellar motor switch protein FliN/FliY